MLKKLLLIILSSLIFLNSMVLPLTARAAEPASAGTWYNQGVGDWFLKVYDSENPSDIFGERYTAAQVQWVIYGIFSNIINIPLGPSGGAVIACSFGSLAANQELATCLGPILNNLFIGYAPTIPNIANSQNQNLLSVVFADRPISGVSYVRNKIQNFSLVPVVNAQATGFGFSALTVVQEMWKSFRDIAFGLFVIVAVVFAFMIMFRVKLSPQTVVSVQSALPKIIGSLIAVTFSYAIAGFLIDLMYIFIGIISLVMAPLIPKVFILQPTVYKAAEVFNLLTIGPVTQPQPGNAYQVAGGVFGLITMYLGPLLVLAIIGVIVALVLTSGALGIGGWIAMAILVILILLCLWITIKTVWALFKAFANILLLTIFAPLQLVLGTLIPNFGFGQWVKSYLSNLSVFVVTGVLFLFAWIFSLQAWLVSGGPDLTILASETTANPWPPLIGTGKFGLGLLFIGVSFVMFTLIPKATEIVAGFISGKPFAYGTAIGEAVAPIGAIYNRTLGPGVAALQKFGSERTTADILTSLDKAMTSGKLQWVPEGVKQFVSGGANKPTTPYH